MSRDLSLSKPAATSLDASLALDVQAPGELRRLARQDPDQALRAASRQFEAIFIGMMLKSMREATPQSGLIDGDATRMYTSLLDQQLAQSMAGRGLRLADALYTQLRRHAPPPESGAGQPAAAAAGGASLEIPQRVAPKATHAQVVAGASIGAPVDSVREGAAYVAVQASPIPAPRVTVRDLAPLAIPGPGGEVRKAAGALRARVDQFVGRLGEAAQGAAQATGIPSALILAQAALESAWGRREPRGADGAPTHNLFGIKADASWRGRVVEVPTTEYVAGVPQRTTAKFRAYDSYQEAFADYARFLTRNPRYAQALKQPDAASSAHALQRAGYATDPNYADKLVRVMRRLIN